MIPALSLGELENKISERYDFDEKTIIGIIIQEDVLIYFGRVMVSIFQNICIKENDI